MKSYSRDIRVRIVKAYQNKEGSQRQIAARFDVSLSFVRDLLRRFRETGSLEPKPHKGGHPKKINEEDLTVLRDLLAQSPRATLNELCEHFARRYHRVKPSRTTMHRVVKRLKKEQT